MCVWQYELPLWMMSGCVVCSLILSSDYRVCLSESSLEMLHVGC